MDIISALLLVTSAILASFRNVLMKSFSPFSFKNREFYGIQALIFAVGSVILFGVNAFSFDGISWFTVYMALIYGVMLLCAQWCYTIALSNGKTAVCVTIYSFGFLIPTLSGAMFWSEEITVCGALGIVTVIPVILISGFGKKSNGSKGSTKSYLIPLILAMLCSGGLGVVQKIQQKSEYVSQTNTFVLIAFIFCFAVSLSFFLVMKKGQNQISRKNMYSCAAIGLFFSTCNLLNTFLAGALDSAIFFPVLNISGILLSSALGILIYKEKLTKKDVAVLILAIISIVLVNF